MQIEVVQFEPGPHRFTPIAITLDRTAAVVPASGDARLRRMLDEALHMQPFATDPATADAPLLTIAWPFGPIGRNAYDWGCERLLDAVASSRCEQVAIDLHGSVEVVGLHDANAAMLLRLRQALRDVPMSVTQDFHADLSAAIVDLANIVSGYPTYARSDGRSSERGPRILLQVQRRAPT